MTENEEWEEFLSDLDNMTIEDLKYQLHMAADNNYSGKYLNEIIIRGVDVNDRNRRGETALFHSAVCENVDAVALLLSIGANPNIYNNADDSALGYAVLFGNPEITSLLITAGASLEIVNNEEHSILNLALQRADENDNSVDVIRLLLAAGIDTKKMLGTKTPLEMAIYTKKQEIINLFKE